MSINYLTNLLNAQPTVSLTSARKASLTESFAHGESAETADMQLLWSVSTRRDCVSG